MAEEVGFEPTVPEGTTVFKTAAFVRSATPPGIFKYNLYILSPFRGVCDLEFEGRTNRANYWLEVIYHSPGQKDCVSLKRVVSPSTASSASVPCASMQTLWPRFMARLKIPKIDSASHRPDRCKAITLL